MIRVDRRIGSGPLQGYFRQPYELVDLACGDFVFEGIGESGQPLSIAVERKTVSEIVTSILGYDRRLVTHQIPLLKRTHDEVYLVVEGVVRTGEKCLLEVPKGSGWVKPTFGRVELSTLTFDSYLTSLETLGGLRLRRTQGKRHTIQWVETLYHWWSKGVDKHKTLACLYRPPLARHPFRQPTQVALMAGTLPGVGPTLAERVSVRFKTPIDMVAASLSEWMEIEGISNGKAATILKAIGKELL